MYASYYIVIRGLSGCMLFSHIISQTQRFSGKKKIEHKTCVWSVSLYLVSEIFLH